MRGPVLPPNTPQPLDGELLAWAAGFFDGEGSTFARTNSYRPGYFELDVSVPQSGPTGVPEVLLKFQRAMLGVGRIYRQSGTYMYKWDSCGRVSAEMSLALMWPWLGTIKRAQALSAIATFDRQYEEGRIQQRRPRYTPELVPHVITESSGWERQELAWAAGFLDGEGSFCLPKKYARVDGTYGFVTRVSAPQHGATGIPAEVLTKMARILGGRIERHGELDDFRWVIQGLDNVGRVLDSLRPWLGAVKIQQAEAALTKASANRSTRAIGDAERCKRGHLYDGVKTNADGTLHQTCSACARITERARRLARGGKPRRVNNPSGDPSRVYAV